jgi:hypothetical protein
MHVQLPSVALRESRERWLVAGSDSLQDRLVGLGG